MTNQFTFFWNANSPFSQFYPTKFQIDNKEFNCAEQFMMYSKAITFNDYDIADKILEEQRPEKQKKLGRLVDNFDPIKWNNIAEHIVYQGNYAKFTQNTNLLEKLFLTDKSELVEVNPSDTIWGIGLPPNNPQIYDKRKWRGQNKLGIILTKLREDLKQENKYIKLINNIKRQ